MMPDLAWRLEYNYYMEKQYRVFTEGAHLRRGSCCGSNCRHCPFEPQGKRGNTRVSPELEVLQES